MGYSLVQLLLSVEALERIEKELSQLIRSGYAPRQVINKALYRRDLAVEEVQKWNQRVHGSSSLTVKSERRRCEGSGSEHP